MAAQRRTRISLTATTLLVVLAFVFFWSGAAGAATGLQNEGFEDGLAGWDVTVPSTAPEGTVAAVGSETSDMYPIYESMNITSVDPVGGAKMLRIGLPKDVDSAQVRGVEEVKQEFESDGSPIDLVYNLFTVDHRSTDSFVVDVKDSAGTSVGHWTADSTVDPSTGSIPYTAPVSITKTEKYWHSGWVELRLGDLPSGTLTISYTLSNTANSAHDTWVYVDCRNEPPHTGTVAITPKPAYAGSQTFTATVSDFSDPDDDVLTYTYTWTVTPSGTSTETPLGTTTSTDTSAGIDATVVRGDTIAVSVTASDGTDTTTPAAEDQVTVSNSPPVADFTWSPGGPGNNPDEVPHEGDVIGLYSDPSTDRDGSADIVKWEWRINKPGRTEEVYNGLNDYQSPAGFIVPYDEGTYAVTLTIWDVAEESSSVTKEILVQNQEPRVNALNIEVLSGGSADLIGRILDTGWMDTHTAEWISPSGAAISGDVTEDHLATIGSGVVSGSVSAAASLAAQIWTLTVSDGTRSSSDTFKVTTIAADDPNRFESEGEFPDSVHALNSDGAYLSYIQSEGDVDIYEVMMPDGKFLPQGTEILATLRDLPADYDLVMFEGTSGTAPTTDVQAAPFMHSPFLAAPFMHSPFMHSDTSPSPFMHSPFMHSPYEEAAFMQAPFMHSPFMHSPFMHSPYVNAPFAYAPFMHSPFMHSPFMHSPFMHSPFMHSPLETAQTSLDGYPLSEMSYTGTANDNTSGIDISFSELGFDNEAMQNLRVIGFSANLGTESEVVLATAGYPQTVALEGHVYVAVKGMPGHFSATEPYTLQIETSQPYDALAQGNVDQQPLVAEPTTSTDEVYTPSGAPLTLFVTQLERLDALYPAGTTGDGPDGGAVVEQTLKGVAGRTDVKGKIISLAGNLYTAWDKQPWRLDLADTLTRAIRDTIQAQLAANPSIQYVVMVGDDRVVPFRRVADQTVIGNEQGYRDQAFILPPSATLSSIANGYFFTDDYYVDKNPIGWSGGYIYVPDLSISRLVETPEEIAGTIEAFKAADGVLTPQAAVVSGYSFMANGAEAVRTTLTNAGVEMLSTSALVSETWTGTDLWEALEWAADLTGLNAHFTHFAGISANGYALSVEGDSFDVSELFLSTDVAGDRGKVFNGGLIFSMGCHSGLSVPDKQAVATFEGEAIDPGLDLPQAMMKQGAIYMAPTGYGYGDTVGIAGTEALLGYIAEKVVGTSSAAPSASLGLALAEAKQAYLGSLSTITPYEQKSSVEYVMYGMPQYRLTTSGAAAAATTPVAVMSLVNASATPLDDPFHLKVTERSMQTAWTNTAIDQNYALAVETASAETGSSGSYITADGKSEANPERPIHPTVGVALGEQPTQGPAHGFVYKSGTYAFPVDPFEPAISRITNEWEVAPTEFELATSGWWPAEPAVLTTIQNPSGYQQTFVAVPAQFAPTSTSPTVTGSERVWSYLEAEVLRSTPPAGGAEDWTPPSVLGYDFWLTGGQVTLSVNAKDASGISRIVVLIMGANGMTTPAGGDHYFGNPGVPNGDDGRYDVTFDPAGVGPTTLTLMIQVVDGRGNVTTLTGKGINIRLTSGLRNPSFEEGAKYWTLSQPAPDSAVVVGTEGADQYPVFDTWGVTVEPYTGVNMLRLGTPRDQNAHQVKGVSSATQQFLSDGNDILIAYRVVTFEPRLEDFFVISLEDSNGDSIGQIAGKALPFSLSVQLDDNKTLLDTDWVILRIAEVPEGKVLTLSYALNNTKSASQDTWVYVDQGK